MTFASVGMRVSVMKLNIPSALIELGIGCSAES